MTTAIIVTLTSLLIIAYIFDLTSSKTRIPAVILLLLLGWMARKMAGFFEVQLPDLGRLLPVFGQVGLILIVLEGALELELDRSKAGHIGKSLIVALVPMLLLAFGLAWLFSFYGHVPFRAALVNAIPLCVISSAIAIPSVKSLAARDREFVIYESSLSDILGVLFFNFVALNSSYGFASVGHFVWELALMGIISLLATMVLALLMKSIDHPIKFMPIIMSIILIYTISKEYHLPALIFILIFGLALGNLDELKRYRWVRWLKPGILDAEVHRFRDVVVEIAFFIRAVFFLLFGYLIQRAELLNPQTFVWAVIVVIGIFGLRALLLRLVSLKLAPLLYIAPRGLITILLFLSIPPGQQIALVDRPLIIQVILLSAIVMMLGMMFRKKPESPVIGPEAIPGEKPVGEV